MEHVPDGCGLLLRISVWIREAYGHQLFPVPVHVGLQLLPEVLVHHRVHHSPVGADVIQDDRSLGMGLLRGLVLDLLAYCPGGHAVIRQVFGLLGGYRRASSKGQPCRVLGPVAFVELPVQVRLGAPLERERIVYDIAAGGKVMQVHTYLHVYDPVPVDRSQQRPLLGQLVVQHGLVEAYIEVSLLRVLVAHALQEQLDVIPVDYVACASRVVVHAQHHQRRGQACVCDELGLSVNPYRRAEHRNRVSSLPLNHPDIVKHMLHVRVGQT